MEKILQIGYNIFLTFVAVFLSIFIGNPIPLKRNRKVKHQNVEVLIVGAGVSGLAIAKKLNDIGLARYTILERGAEVGGTWYWNKVVLLEEFILYYLLLVSRSGE